MKKHFRFLALMISCMIAATAPMSALCSEAVSAGETSEETEAAAEEEPEGELPDVTEKEPEDTEAGTEETVTAEEETIEEEAAVEEAVEEDEEETADEPSDDEKPANAENDSTETETSQAGTEDSLPGEEEAIPATEGFCGEKLTWEYSDGILYIKGTGEMYDYDKVTQPEWSVYAEEIEELRIGKGITLIDGDAFENLKELKSIYFEGSEKEWKELEYEKDTEDPEGSVNSEKTRTVGINSMKDVFAGVKEYSFGEESPEGAEEEKAAEEEPKRAAKLSAEGTADSLQIVTEPEDISAAVGDSVSLHVETSGEDVYYQWQWSRDGKSWNDCTSAGNDTDTFSFVMKETLNGRKYRCLVYNDSDEIMTRVATVTVAVKEELRITIQPENVTAAAGENVNMHVEANKPDAAYQWQWSRDGKSWKDCTSAGCKTDTFSFVMKDTLDGRHYRCIVTSGDEQLTSDVAVVTCKEEALEITVQPGDVTASSGETVNMHVEANKPDVAYQWQWSRDGKSWKDCTSAGCKTDTFSFVMKDTLDGRHYRCIVTSGSEQLISDVAVVTSAEPLEITAQPEDVTAGNGETVYFHVEANKSGVTYKWQWSTDGDTWKDCKSSGYNTDTMSFSMWKTYSGRQYRCVVTSGSEQKISEAATLTYGALFEITAQPEDVEAGDGETVRFYVEASGTVTYRWQWSADGTTWKNCSSAGYNTDTMHFVMREAYSGRQYRCIVTSGSEQKTSEAATVTFAAPLVIITQPEDAAAKDGETVSYHVEVSGNSADVTYQWQYSLNGSYWGNCKGTGYDTDTFSFTMQEKFAGRQYRCIVTKGTRTMTTRAAQLTLADSEIVIEGVVYELIDDVMTVTGYRGSADEVVVQETVEGYTVTVIGEGAFEGSAIRSIDLPDTIQLIRKRAFADCINLTNMN